MRAVSLILLPMVVLVSMSRSQEIWTLEVSCTVVEELSSDVRCGDCLKVKYATGSSLQESDQKNTLGVKLKARCTKCSYYIANDEVMTGDQLKRLGENGCTWKSANFFTKHPVFIMFIFAVVFLLIGVCLGIICCRTKNSNTAIYRITE